MRSLLLWMTRKKIWRTEYSVDGTRHCRHCHTMEIQAALLKRILFPKALCHPLRSSDERWTLEGEEAIESETLCTVLEDAPPLPTDSDCFSASTVKASAVISGIQKSHLLDIPWPFYLINTRDCFKYDLIEVKIKVRLMHCLDGLLLRVLLADVHGQQRIY